MEHTAKDFFGNDLQIGDTVAFMRKEYRYLIEGKVIKITAKTILIEHEPLNGYYAQTKQSPNQVIK